MSSDTSRIIRVESFSEQLELSRPYTIATRTISAVELSFVRIESAGGHLGCGSASPSPGVTGETSEACRAALEPATLDWLVGADACHLGAHLRRVHRELTERPAARAALDMALHDLFARIVGVPLVDLLGRVHEALPTSITIGIMGVEPTLEEAEEYVGRGFRLLKVKIGRDFEEDVERLRKLRERYGDAIVIRVDANQGYDVPKTLQLAELARELDIELIEQPLIAGEIDGLRQLPPEVRRLVAADETLQREADALRLAAEPPACGIFNIKLMKCGGVSPGVTIARIAELASIELMWGCMDESALSIAAALHAAYASPATRYIDLDGNFDLARDIAENGPRLDHGVLRLPDGPGLGTRLPR